MLDKLGKLVVEMMMDYSGVDGGLCAILRQASSGWNDVWQNLIVMGGRMVHGRNNCGWQDNFWGSWRVISSSLWLVEFLWAIEIIVSLNTKDWKITFWGRETNNMLQKVFNIVPLEVQEMMRKKLGEAFLNLTYYFKG